MSSRGVNKVIIVGNLGNDPEVRNTNSGAAIATISVATSDSWKDKQTGQPVEKVEWHRVVFFNRLAEIVRDYVKKGSKVYIEGRLQTRKWQDTNGQDRYTTEIVASEMQMLDGKEGITKEQGYQAPNQAPQQQQAQSHSNGHQQQAPQHQAPAGGFDSFDDDIPF